ncbi:TcpQ domain-containing protein [Vibrio breoganii]
MTTKPSSLQKTFKVMITAAVLSCGVATTVAHADLYISPALRGTVTLDKPEEAAKPEDAKKGTDAVSGQHKGKVVSGKSERHGNFMMRETNTEQEEKPFAYGTNVPLFVAVESNVPNKDKWIFHIDESIQNRVVNWATSTTGWQAVLKEIAEQNNFHVHINHEESAIGVASTEKLAFHFGHAIPQVWVMEAGRSLKENLRNWAERAGWRLMWSNNLEIDYITEQSAIFTGEFLTEDSKGVIYEVTQATLTTDEPLKPTFYTRNKVLLIESSGYSQEVEF